MRLPFLIARRYLFAKKSTNAINIITGISVFGLTIGTMALILVLSVFNGLHDLLLTLFSNFNPPIKVTPVQGKTFSPDSIDLNDIIHLDDVAFVSQTLEEVTLLEHDNVQREGVIKGVDSLFRYVVPIDSTIYEGDFFLQRDVISFGIYGIGLAQRLQLEVGNVFDGVNVYMPKKQRSAIGTPFRKQFLHTAGTFIFQRDYDAEYVLTNLDFVQRLLGGTNEISALEIRLQADADAAATKQAIKNILGASFHVKDQYEQEEAFLKITNMEKWVSFAILSLALLLVAFNMIGALWMIVLEKRRDISILKSMGMQDLTVRN
ncbi:MAG: ABC transporter permease, partial [Bacteroidota bacterium]